MKAGTIEHIKFKRLKRTLKLRDWECVGLLESLWLFTARSHMCGDIGKSSNLDIALALDWDGDEDELINCLVKAGWVDKCLDNRLVVHDWENHCPNYVKGNLAKHNKSFAKHRAKQGGKRGAKDGAGDTATKPSLANPSEYTPSFEEVWELYGRKGNKISAFKYWQKLSEKDQTLIKERIPEYVASCSEKKFQKDFQGWINPAKRRWEDEVIKNDHNKPTEDVAKILKDYK
ncbi:MAG: hypothetical protein ACN2B6_12405 [Rickettsiales bacterium]